MKESMRVDVSGRFTVKLPSLRPLMTSNPLDPECCDDVGDVTGEDDGEMAVLSFVVKERKRGILDVVESRMI